MCLDREEPEPEPVPIMEPSVLNGNGHAHIQIALAIRTLRQRSGLSQRQLALRMQVPRTYVSKIENDKATPTLSSLRRLAVALEVSVPALLEQSTNAIANSRLEEIRELLTDSFIAELAPFVSKLDAMQRSTFLTQVRELTMHPRRTS